MPDLRLALRLARRELRGGFAGFRIFFFCLLLGAAAIAGVESLSDAFLTGLQDQGQVLLGGDVSVRLVHRPASAAERAFLDEQGTRRGNASRCAPWPMRQDNQNRQLVELKAVDDHWPLFGTPQFTPAQDLHDALACEEDGICGAAAEQTLLDRLHVKRGDLIKLGNATFRIMGALDKEPDRISTGFSLGPRLLISSKGLPATGLVSPESLVDYSYRIALNGASSDPVQARGAIDRFRDRAEAAFPDAGWNIRDRSDAAPGIKRFVEQLTMFLTLVGLVALGVAGVGAAQAILAFLDRKRADIAILKTLGASGSFVFLVFFLQVMAVALLATLVGAGHRRHAAFRRGLVLWRCPAGAAQLRLLSHPDPAGGGLRLAVGRGLRRAAAVRARAVPPASLFRDTVAPAKAEGQNLYRAISAGAALGVMVLTLIVAPSPVFAAEFLAGAVAALALLRLLAEGVRRLIARMPRPDSPLLRLAFANLVRPGAATGGVVTALGLGLTLLATVTLINATINEQVAGALPARAPSFFFVDIQPGEADSLRPHRHRLFRRQRLQAHADDPRPHHILEWRAVGGGQSRARRQMGAEWRPRHHLCRHAAAGHRHHRRQMVGGRLSRPHFDLAGSGHRPRHGPEDRRQHDLERPGPQLRGHASQACARWTSPMAGRISCWCCRRA